MGMKIWYVHVRNASGFKVEAETYDGAWHKAQQSDEYEAGDVLNVVLCEEEYCAECLETTCKDNPNG